MPLHELGGTFDRLVSLFYPVFGDQHGFAVRSKKQLLSKQTAEHIVFLRFFSHLAFVPYGGPPGPISVPATPPFFKLHARVRSRAFIREWVQCNLRTESCSMVCLMQHDFDPSRDLSQERTSSPTCYLYASISLLIHHMITAPVP